MAAAAAAASLFLLLWCAAAELLPVASACPEVCTCSDKHGRFSAQCSYKNLAEVPADLPPNVSAVSLSVNRIGSVPLGSFHNLTQVTSLWMAHNQIAALEPGSLLPLALLRNLDVSHNRLADFPWADLQGLSALQLLKLNHNRLSALPRRAFRNLAALNSIRLNDNRFAAVAEGTFDGLPSLSHLHVYGNPFECGCRLDWLREWLATTTITVPYQDLIVCAAPEALRGAPIASLSESKCASPNATVRPERGGALFHEGGEMRLRCEIMGNPEPTVTWSVESVERKGELSGDDPPESVRVFDNGTLVVSNLTLGDSGNYSCSAANEFGRAEDSLAVEVVEAPAPTTAEPAAPTEAETTSAPTVEVWEIAPHPDVEEEDSRSDELTTESREDSDSHEDLTTRRQRPGHCVLTEETKNVSGYVFNRSLDDVKQLTFDFGVVALGVSETEALVHLNLLLLLAGQDESSQQEPDKVQANGLYLCLVSDGTHSAVQWQRLRQGVDTYVFGDLQPDTNYSLCVTYRGEDCEVQVLFATRREVPNLLVIVSVCICLLTVSTVPLLGATCFHLVYTYRGRTYKLILKAKDQCQLDRGLPMGLAVRAAHTESQRGIAGSQAGEEDGETESADDGHREPDTEESIVTESVSLSQGQGNADEGDGGSEFSDRLPLGAEAVNITSNCKHPRQ